MVGHVPGGALRAARRRQVMPCAHVRQALCRMAVGAPAREAPARLAGHARRCPGCAAFADDVAQVRAWLGRPSAAPPAESRHGGDARDARDACAREALVRELAARIARDLLATAGLAPPRAPSDVAADRTRLLALLEPGARAGAPWREVLALHAAPGAAPSLARRARAAALAAELDPLGLDVLLGHLAQLERTGRRAQADGDADGLLARLG